MSETFSRADQPNDLPPYDGYSTWNTERSGSDKGGGGLTILYRESLVAHQWTPPVPPDLQYISNERQWLLITSQKEKCAFLHCYIACQNNKDDSFIKWNEDLFGMITKEAIQLRQQGFVTLALGDFNSRVGQIAGLEGNTPDINRNQPMFMSLITEVNIVIVNTLPINNNNNNNNVFPISTIQHCRHLVQQSVTWSLLGDHLSRIYPFLPFIHLSNIFILF